MKTKPEWLPGLVDTARHNQSLIKNAVDKIDGVELPVYPSAASMMVIDISKHNANPQDVQDKLLYDYDIFCKELEITFQLDLVITSLEFHFQSQPLKLKNL